MAKVEGARRAVGDEAREVIVRILAALSEMKGHCRSFRKEMTQSDFYYK